MVGQKYNQLIWLSSLQLILYTCDEMTVEQTRYGKLPSNPCATHSAGCATHSVQNENKANSVQLSSLETLFVSYLFGSNTRGDLGHPADRLSSLVILFPL